MNNNNNRRNNFDLIRLLAALEVAVYHGLIFFNVPVPSRVATAMGLFPGVPIFFCISGFLIAKSVERNGENLRRYAWARMLRIYPALILCSTLWLLLMFALGTFREVAFWKIGAWYLSCVTLGGSAMNPEFFRSFGTGVWNGALWTVGIEITFYVALPIFYLFERWGRSALNALLFGLCALSFTLFMCFHGLHFGDTHHYGALTKVVWFSLAGNLWMLLFGTLIHRFFHVLRPFLVDRVVWVLAAYLLLEFLSSGQSVDGDHQIILISSFFFTRLALAFLTISAAYSFCGLSSFLRGNDISYGTYIYHMPVYNLFVQFGYAFPSWFPVALATAVGFGWASWRLVERQALRLKDRDYLLSPTYLFAPASRIVSVGPEKTDSL